MDTPSSQGKADRDFKFMVACGPFQLFVPVLLGEELGLGWTWTWCLTVQGVFLIACIHHRIANAVPRPRLSAGRIGSAVVPFALMALFFLSATPDMSLSDPRSAFWYSGGTLMAVFFVLGTLWPLTPLTPEVEDSRPARAWQGALTGFLALLFLCGWLCGVGYFYFSSLAVKTGSPTPNASQGVAYTEKGRTVYITPEERHRIDVLSNAWVFTIIPALLGGLLLSKLDKRQDKGDATD